MRLCLIARRLREYDPLLNLDLLSRTSPHFLHRTPFLYKFFDSTRWSCTRPAYQGFADSALQEDVLANRRRCCSRRSPTLHYRNILVFSKRAGGKLNHLALPLGYGLQQ